MEGEKIQASHGREKGSKAEESVSRVSGPHHVPLCTDVRPRSNDGQQTNVTGQLEEVLYVPVPTEVIQARICFVVVPGDIPLTYNQDQTAWCKFTNWPLTILLFKIYWKQSGIKIMLHDRRYQNANKTTMGNKINIQLDSVQACQVHLHEPILPVNLGDPVVMDASWYVTKLFPIFPKAVVLVIHTKWAGGCQLQVRKTWLTPEIPSLWPSKWCMLVSNGWAVASQLTWAWILAIWFFFF